jgi:hypothetical protein
MVRGDYLQTMAVVHKLPRQASEKCAGTGTEGFGIKNRYALLEIIIIISIKVWKTENNVMA